MSIMFAGTERAIRNMSVARHKVMSMPSHRVTQRRLLRRSTRTWEPPQITSPLSPEDRRMGLSRGMRPEPVEGCIPAALRPAQCAEPPLSTTSVQNSCGFRRPLGTITGCLGSTYFAALTIRCTSAVLVILNIGCSSMRSVVRMPIRRIVDRWHLPGLKSVSTLMTHTCLNTRSRDGGARRSWR
jgi:hypothetical protein